MKYRNQIIYLKNGSMAELRSPLSSDAGTVLGFVKETSGETEFLLRYPEECTETEEQERNKLETMADSGSACMISCFIGDTLAGLCCVQWSCRMKTAHRASVSITTLRKFWGIGIGTEMMRAMEEIAAAKGICQMELTYIEGNARAEALYTRMGYRVTGELPDAIRLKDGTRLKEITMIKRIGG